ncbi:MAG: glycoside hydrolase family 16 protein [Verrucomicrobiota bacterium]
MNIKIALSLFSLLLAGLAAWGADDWKLVWSDEFNRDGPPDPANWDYERGFMRNQELQWYQPENAYCTNGLLILEARPEHKRNPDYAPASASWKKNREWIDYTSASLTTRRLREFKYGKFELRARINTQSGSWPSFWMQGARPLVRWPARGEIDIMEYYAGQIRANIAYQHYGSAKWSFAAKPVAGLGGDAWSNAFHIWTMEWNATNLDLRLDGHLMNHLEVATADGADRGNPFHFPAFFLLSQAIGSNGGDPAHTPFPIRLEVDWVRVYQLKD